MNLYYSMQNDYLLTQKYLKVITITDVQCFCKIEPDVQKCIRRAVRRLYLYKETHKIYKNRFFLVFLHVCISLHS